MLRLIGRLAKLEKVLAPVRDATKRWIVVVVGGRPANLANAKCIRRVSNGVLMEVVQLDGNRDGLSEEQLNTFVESFPIEGAARC
jgi:hypothetical protein